MPQKLETARNGRIPEKGLTNNGPELTLKWSGLLLTKFWTSAALAKSKQKKRTTYYHPFQDQYNLKLSTSTPDNQYSASQTVVQNLWDKSRILPKYAPEA